MSAVNFNKDFTNAFTQNCTLYSATEEYRHGNLLFIQFAGNTKEMKPIAISVAKNMYQGQVVSRILNLLENKSIPQTAFLCTSAKALIDEFNTYIQHEPYTCSRCNELIHTLKSFYELINALNNHICKQVSNKLKDINSVIYNPGPHVDIDGFYLYEVIDQIEFYLKNLLTYYYHFLVVKEQEREDGNGIGLSTQVSDSLWELTGVIETVCNNIEEVIDILLTWEVSMDIYEEQALFN